jgi:hypothetical protein
VLHVLGAEPVPLVSAAAVGEPAGAGVHLLVFTSAETPTAAPFPEKKRR